MTVEKERPFEKTKHSEEEARDSLDLNPIELMFRQVKLEISRSNLTNR